MKGVVSAPLKIIFNSTKVDFCCLLPFLILFVCFRSRDVRIYVSLKKMLSGGFEFVHVTIINTHVVGTPKYKIEDLSTKNSKQNCFL